MFEYTIFNLTTGEETSIFGHSYADALERNELNCEDYDLIMEDYID